MDTVGLGTQPPATEPLSSPPSNGYHARAGNHGGRCKEEGPGRKVEGNAAADEENAPDNEDDRDCSRQQVRRFGLMGRDATDEQEGTGGRAVVSSPLYGGWREEEHGIGNSWRS